VGLAVAFLGLSVGHQHLRPLSPKPSSVLRLPRHRRRLVDPFDFDGNQSDDPAVAARPAMFAKRLFHKALHHHHQGEGGAPPAAPGDVPQMDAQIALHYGVPYTASLLAFDPVQPPRRRNAVSLDSKSLSSIRIP